MAPERFPSRGRPPFRVPPREREALTKLCEQAVRLGSPTYELLARPATPYVARLLEQARVR